MRNARRVALTSLGAGLAVGAAAPVASAATGADESPIASPAVVAATSAFDMAPSATNLVTGARTASEAQLPGASGAGWSRLGHLKLYPLAGSGIDPLSNMVSTNLGGIPVSTAPVTQMMEDGLPIADLPVVGSLLGTARN